jgi:chemotaxis protein CheD
MKNYMTGAELQAAQALDKLAAVGKTYTIGIAEQKVARAPDKLVTLGLGSCVGVVLFDPALKLGGMVHIMLPVAPQGGPVSNLSKFANTGIPELLRLMTQSGARCGRLIAKLAGGAHMFNAMYNTDVLNVGERNAQECKKILRANGIVIAAEDTGGTNGRSIEFCCETGVLQVRTVSPRSIQLL